MKLVLAIVSGDNSTKVSTALTKGGFFVTKLATTGGFLAAGNTTFIIGTQNEKVDELIEIIKNNSATRKKITSSAIPYGMGMFSDVPVEIETGGATVFVLDIEQFYKL